MAQSQMSQASPAEAVSNPCAVEDLAENGAGLGPSDPDPDTDALELIRAARARLGLNSNQALLMQSRDESGSFHKGIQ